MMAAQLIEMLEVPGQKRDQLELEVLCQLLRGLGTQIAEGPLQVLPRQISRVRDLRDAEILDRQNGRATSAEPTDGKAIQGALDGSLELLPALSERHIGQLS